MYPKIDQYKESKIKRKGLKLGPQVENFRVSASAAEFIIINLD